MARFIIDVRDDIDPVTALVRVATVIRQGKISEARGIKHYCWHTTFRTDKIAVSAREKKKDTSADSFWVWEDA